MLGSTFGISADDPYFWPGHTASQPSLISELEGAGKNWKAYLQGLPYAGYRGYRALQTQPGPMVAVPVRRCRRAAALAAAGTSGSWPRA